MGLLQNLVELSNDPSCFFREKQVSAWVIQYIFFICSKVFFEKYTLPTTTEELRSIADCVKAAPWIYPGAWGFGRHFSRWCHFAFTIQDLSCRHKRRQRVWLWMHESNHRHRQQTAKKRSRLDSGEPRLPVFLCLLVWGTCCKSSVILKLLCFDLQKGRFRQLPLG